MGKRSLIGSAFLLAAVAPAIPARAEIKFGDFQLTGFYRDTINLATATNPNNTNLVAEPGRPNFLLAQQYLNLNLRWAPSEDFTGFIETRLYHDATKSLDDHYRQYQSFPRDFEGNGWMARAGGNDFVAELTQAYFDYRHENLWIRAGKQSIAWGEMVALRVLDVVEPLDLNQMFFFNRAFEEFDDYRIPQWFIRSNYHFDALPNVNWELFVNPGQVVPTLLPAQGAPYNILPSTILYKDKVTQGQPVVGAKVAGELGDWAYSLNYITKPNDDGVGIPVGLTPTPRGFPLVPGDSTLYRVLVNGQHPRINVFGGSLSVPWDAAGAFVRFETTITPDAPFAKGAEPTKIVERPVWKWSVSVDRPTYVIPGQDSLSITGTFLSTATFGSSDEIGFDDEVPQLALFFQQPFLRKEVSVEYLASIDLDGAVWMQPGVHWEVGDSWRFDAYYNYFDGSRDEPGRLGYFAFASGPFVRTTYGF